MRSVVRVGLSLVPVLATALLVVHSSCKRDDNCKGVVCQHKGTCSSGFCVCPSGVGGDTCQTIYSHLYDNKYSGTANVNTAHIGYTLIFSVPANAASFRSMSLSVIKGTGGASNIPVLPVVLGTTTNSISADVSIAATTIGGATYSGNGTLYANQGSLTLTKTQAGTPDTTYVCANFGLVQ